MTPLNSLHRVSQSLTQSVSHDVFLSGGSRGTSVSQFVQVVGQIWFLEIVALRFPLHLEAAHILSYADCHQHWGARPSFTCLSVPSLELQL